MAPPVLMFPWPWFPGDTVLDVVPVGMRPILSVPVTRAEASVVALALLPAGP
jgi:hypothetical protein